MTRGFASAKTATYLVHIALCISSMPLIGPPRYHPITLLPSATKMSTSTPSIPASLADTHALLLVYNTASIAELIVTEKLPKPLLLHPTARTPNARDLRRTSKLKSGSRNRSQPLTAREKRALGVHSLPKGLKHETFAPLRELWTKYARGLAVNGATVMAQRLAGADLHGAVVEVVRSRAVDRVGIRGTVVKETRGVVVVVTEDDRVKSTSLFPGAWRRN